VARVTDDGSPDLVAPEERVAVFDNDGTLWCEKPMPIELGFILQRLAAMAGEDPKLRDRQPWKAAYDRDDGWPGEVITRHYHGDDSDVKVLIGGVLQAFAGMDVQDYQGGDRDVMRPVAQRIYGIPSERVIGSTNALRYEPNEQGGSIV
jgi:hypothetical protein